MQNYAILKLILYHRSGMFNGIQEKRLNKLWRSMAITGILTDPPHALLIPTIIERFLR